LSLATYFARGQLSKFKCMIGFGPQPILVLFRPFLLKVSFDPSLNESFYGGIKKTYNTINNL
jgi:hypothetical protein